MKVIIFIVGIFVIVGLYFLVKPNSGNNTKPSVENKVVSKDSNKVKNFEISFKNKKVSVQSNVLQVNEGDRVVIKVSSDEDEELHLHGYDLSVELSKDQPRELSFIASHSGRFGLELHHNELEIATVEVMPK